ncbi:MAG: hypothetical protein J6W60_12275, partial [Treponema sp.]|nr:hypothetical protein [Treponema sp.]
NIYGEGICIFNTKAGEILNFFSSNSPGPFFVVFSRELWYSVMWRLENRPMNKHGKNILEAVIATLVIIVFYGIYFGVIISGIDSMLIKLLIGIIPAILGVMIIYVCIQRIREIKGGQEDDLGKY